jgi:hypothetical protein
MRLLLVANPEPTQVGAHLLEAARTLGVDVRLCDARQAYEGPVIIRKASWWLAGRRPAALRAFGLGVRRAAEAFRPQMLLATGLAPLDLETLTAIGAAGVPRVNFLTDDPWNPAHHAPWFLRALPAYDIVFSPRHANQADLTRAGVARVEYLPFAYSPSAHRHDPPGTEDEARKFRADVLLAGGADDDRVRLVTPLIRAGLNVALYGGYWDRHAATRTSARGFLDAAGLRRATSAAAVCLGLVRRANRDGHSMRTFEVPAMRGCLLAEDTPDHRDLFGSDDEGRYVRGADDIVDRTRALVADPRRRERLIAQAHDRITGGRHTYADRLSVMLGIAP